VEYPADDACATTFSIILLALIRKSDAPGLKVTKNCCLREAIFVKCGGGALHVMIHWGNPSSGKMFTLESIVHFRMFLQ
jgi:hypothetical protein